jgi:hypothetical protein
MSEATATAPGSRAFEPLSQSDQRGAVSLRGLTLLVGTKKRPVLLDGFTLAQAFQTEWSGVSRPHRSSRDRRSARRAHAAGRAAHRAPRSHRVSFHRLRRDVAGVDEAARVFQTEGRAAFDDGRAGVLAGAGTRERTGIWYAGTSPEGLFRSEDGGATWQPVPGWNDHPKWLEWTGDMKERNPDGSPHPRDPNSAWVFPMDGTDVWPRTCPGGKPAVYRTRDGGETWTRLACGFPERAWYTVLRQSMAVDAQSEIGVYVGTTNGEVWGRRAVALSRVAPAAHLLPRSGRVRELKR